MSTYGISNKASASICAAIENYVRDLRKSNEIAIDKTKLNAAFKGSSTQTQILNMAKAVDDRAKNLANNLIKLEEAINKLNADYKKDDSDYSGTLNSTVKELANYNVKWSNSPNMASTTSDINRVATTIKS